MGTTEIDLKKTKEKFYELIEVYFDVNFISVGTKTSIYKQSG